MSSPITPPQTAGQPVLPAGATAPSVAHKGTGTPFAVELTASLDAIQPDTPQEVLDHPAVSLDAIPSSPPQEVLDQMAGAAQTHAALSAQGRELRFSRDEHSGRTRIEVRDRGGNVLRTLSPAEALEVAAGAPLG